MRIDSLLIQERGGIGCTGNSVLPVLL